MTGSDRPVVDFFAVLGLGPDADEAAVRRAFRTRARDTHPDRGGDAAAFLRVNQAYEALRTPEGRALAARAVREQRRRDPTARRGSDADPRPSSRREGSPAPTGRLPEHDQDRLVREFFRSHPAAARGGQAAPADPVPGTGSAPAGRSPRNRRGTVLVCLAALAASAVAVVLLLPDLLPGPLGVWVQVVTG